MNQEIQALFEVDAMKVAVGDTPDPEAATLPQQVLDQAFVAHPERTERHVLHDLSKNVFALVHRLPPMMENIAGSQM